MVRDLYACEIGARVLSTLILIKGVAPLLGPLLGGQILAVEPAGHLLAARSRIQVVAKAEGEALPRVGGNSFLLGSTD